MTMVRPSSRLSAVSSVHDLVAARRVEIAGRLVGDEQGRAGDDGAGDGHALLLAAGELGRRVVLAAAQADLGQRLHGELAPLAAGRAAIDQRQLDILGRRGARQQIVALEDEADIEVAQVRAAVAVEPAGVDAVEAVAAGGRRIEAADDVHRRRFARAGRAHDGDELAAVDRQVDAGQRVDLRFALAIGLPDLVEGEQRRAWRAPRSLPRLRRAGDHLVAFREAGDDLGLLAVGRAGLHLTGCGAPSFST